MSKNDGDSPIATLFNIVFVLYIISTQIMTVYFWWGMMKEDNFFVGIFIDPFVAEFQGIFWPFFI